MLICLTVEEMSLPTQMLLWANGLCLKSLTKRDSPNLFFFFLVKTKGNVQDVLYCHSGRKEGQVDLLPGVQ